MAINQNPTAICVPDAPHCPGFGWACCHARPRPAATRQSPSLQPAPEAVCRTWTAFAPTGCYPQPPLVPPAARQLPTRKAPPPCWPATPGWQDESDSSRRIHHGDASWHVPAAAGATFARWCQLEKSIRWSVRARLCERCHGLGRMLIAVKANSAV